MHMMFLGEILVSPIAYSSREAFVLSLLHF